MPVRPLRYILSFQTMLVTAIPFTLVVLFGLFWLYPQIETELESRQQELAGVISSQIESYLLSAVVPVKVDASLLLNKEFEFSSLQPLLDAQIRSSGSIGALYVVGAAGRVMAAGVAHGDRERHQELLLLDLSQNELFKDVHKKRRPAWSDTFLSVVGGGVSVAYAVLSGERVVIGEIRLSKLVEYLKKISSKDDLMVLIVDRHGQVIADRVGRYTAQQFNVSNIPLVKEHMNSHASLSGHFTFDGSEMVGNILHVPDVDWHILVAQPVQAAYRVILVTAGMIIIALLVAMVLAAAAAMFMARRLAGRFEALALQARSVAAGENSGNWPDSTILEIKELSEDLQQMSGTLREREKNLEERNAELVTTDEALHEQIHEFEQSQLKLAQEIGERKRAEEEVHQLNTQLEQRVTERTAQLEVAVAGLSHARDAADAANRAKSTFLANMSHEIRTPMNAVLGFSQLLERDPSLSPQARNKVATIMKSGDHLLSIINDILEMSRIEAGRVELHAESLDLHGLLDDLAVMFRLRAEQVGLFFALESAPDLARYIVADLGKLRQIMINLLGNAVKFTKTGSIMLRAFPAGIDRIAIEVHDSGIGITSVELEKLFRPFERTRSGEQAAGGTGLGLAISQEYAHLMGGEITVTSIVGEGSCFRFEFAAPMTAVAPTSAVKSACRVSTLAPGQGGIRVLVVDDLATNRELLRGMLEPLGFIVDEAADGNEAIVKTNALKPRIVLMDLVMSDMDGGEATRILRRSFSQEELAIIGITASTFEKEKQQFLDSGINAYVAKPFREQELFDALARHAGVLLETADLETLPDMDRHEEIPNLGRMTRAWCESFRDALNRKSITRIRKLGKEADGVDPQLSKWILERTEQYDLKGLNKLTIVE